MASITFKNVSKKYGKNEKYAVKDVNLFIEDKDFIVFVGPSGCGKSTTLRMIAGLEDITDGELYIDDLLVNDIEPKDRDISMVFQNYALYPHMSVFDNLAFGLKARKVPKAERKRKVEEVAEILGITEYLKRKPKALSGGQKQRVALGRAMVREPKVFLLDEPLSNLDAKMRTQMRSEITKLHKKLQTTFVYVTHDQVEAMTMGNKIVVMKDGIVQQVDTPNNLYIKPANKFVASFIGTPQIVFFTVKIIMENGKLYFKLNDTKQLEVDESIAKIIPENYIDKEVYMGIRAEDTHDDNDLINKNPEKTLKGKISLVERLGNETLVYVNMDDVEGEDLVIRVGTRSHYDINQEIEFMVDTSHVYLFDMETELAILY